VITTVFASAASTIQSSAASNLSDTTTRSISGWSGTRSAMLLTTVTGTARRHATLYTSSFTGQASASTKMRTRVIGMLAVLQILQPAGAALLRRVGRDRLDLRLLGLARFLVRFLLSLGHGPVSCCGAAIAPPPPRHSLMAATLKRFARTGPGLPLDKLAGCAGTGEGPPHPHPRRRNQSHDLSLSAPDARPSPCARRRGVHPRRAPGFGGGAAGRSAALLRGPHRDAGHGQGHVPQGVPHPQHRRRPDRAGRKPDLGPAGRGRRQAVARA